MPVSKLIEISSEHCTVDVSFEIDPLESAYERFAPHVLHFDCVLQVWKHAGVGAGVVRERTTP